MKLSFFSNLTLKIDAIFPVRNLSL